MAKVFDKGAQIERDVSAAEAQRGLQDGTFDLREGSVKVIRGNRTGTVAADKLRDALAKGWDLADPEQVAAAKISREEETIGAQALGTLEAGAGALSFGASTWLEEQAGVDPERMRLRREHAGDAAKYAQAAALLAGGGAGLAAKGATAAKTAASAARGGLPGLATAAGAGITRGISKAVPRLPAPLATGVGQFAEGVAYGAGLELDSSVLGQRDFAVEHVLADGGAAALLGGGAMLAGGRIAKLGQGSRDLFRNVAKVRYADEAVDPMAVETITQRAMGNTADMPERPGTVARAMAFASGAPAEDIALGLRRAQTSEGARNLAMSDLEHAGATAKLAGELRPAVDGVNDAVTDAVRLTEGGNYLKGVELPADANLVGRGRASETLAGARSHFDEVYARAIEYKDGNVGTFVEKARNIVEGAEFGLVEAKNGTDVLRRVDQAQRELRLLVNQAKQVGMRGFIADDAFAAATAARQDLKNLQYDERLWGDAAKLQQEGDALQRAALEAREGVPGKRTAAQRVLDRREPTTDDDLLKVAQKIGRGDGALEESLDGVWQKELEYLRWLEKNREMPPGFSAKVREAERAVANANSKVKINRQRMDDLELRRRLRDYESGGSVSIGSASNMGTVIGGAMGAVFGPIGAGVGALLGRGLASPYTVIRHMASLYRRIDDATMRFDGSLGKFKAGAHKDTPPAPKARTRKEERATAEVETKDYEARKADAESLKSRTVTLSQDPVRLVEELEQTLHDMRQHSPEIATGMIDHVARTAGFLATKIPPVYRHPFSPNKPVADPIAQAAWTRSVEGALYPLLTAERLANGTLSEEHAEALRVCWPTLNEKMVESVWSELAAAIDEGRSVPMWWRMSAGVALNIPTDISLQPAGRAAIQAVWNKQSAADVAQAMKPKRGSSKKLSTPGTAQTPASKTEV